jgi:hypothetical protein
MLEGGAAHFDSSKTAPAKIVPADKLNAIRMPAAVVGSRLLVKPEGFAACTDN